MKNYLLLIALLFTVTTQARPIPLQERMSCFIKAYPTYIYGIDINPINGTGAFHMSNGQTIRWDEHRQQTYKEKLKNADLADMVSLTYPAGRDVNFPPSFDDDPGRFRDDAFLKAVYGKNIKAIKKNLVKVPWMPGTGLKPKYVLFNKKNGAAAALTEVSKELAQLPKRYWPYLNNIAGTFKPRYIAGTNRLSPHSFGIAIDINYKRSHYWRQRGKNLVNVYIPFHNSIPQKIIEIFERNGFIWGGRWYHYDTMHFEYRPELLQPNCLRH